MTEIEFATMLKAEAKKLNNYTEPARKAFSSWSFALSFGTPPASMSLPPTDRWLLSATLKATVSNLEDWKQLADIVKLLGAPKEPIVPLEKLCPNDMIVWSWS